jgi:hypothetical protein
MFAPITYAVYRTERCSIGIGSVEFALWKSQRLFEKVATEKAAPPPNPE